jgi:hypothetical protein
MSWHVTSEIYKNDTVTINWQTDVFIPPRIYECVDMQGNFMSSHQVWPQLGTQAVGTQAVGTQAVGTQAVVTQPLLQPAREGYPDGSFAPLALGPLAAPPQLRTMFDCGGDMCTLHTGFTRSTSAQKEHEWKHRNKDETDCCSKGTVKDAFCDCDPFRCFYTIVHWCF